MHLRHGPCASKCKQKRQKAFRAQSHGRRKKGMSENGPARSPRVRIRVRHTTMTNGTTPRMRKNERNGRRELRGPQSLIQPEMKTKTKMKKKGKHREREKKEDTHIQSPCLNAALGILGFIGSGSPFASASAIRLSCSRASSCRCCSCSSSIWRLCCSSRSISCIRR